MIRLCCTRPDCERHQCCDEQQAVYGAASRHTDCVAAHKGLKSAVYVCSKARPIEQSCGTACEQSFAATGTAVRLASDLRPDRPRNVFGSVHLPALQEVSADNTNQANVKLVKLCDSVWSAA